MRTGIIVLTLVFILLLTPFALAGVDKAVVKSIDFERQGEETLVRITVELYSNGEGEAYLEAIANYDGKDYTTMPLRMLCAFPYRRSPFFCEKAIFVGWTSPKELSRNFPSWWKKRMWWLTSMGRRLPHLRTAEPRT